MLPHETSHETSCQTCQETREASVWRRENLCEDDRVEELRETCPKCAGAGRVREWSMTCFVIAVVGYVCAAVAFFFSQEATAPSFMRSTAIFSFLAGSFGLFILIDRGECPTCGGMGKLDDDEDV